jgi:DNA-binding NarL/FixJ family response regulator
MDINVAIFEDNTLVRRALETILDGTPGFHCCAAFADAQQCIEKINRSKPDVVLMDIEMPGTDGIAATQLLSKEFPGIRIIIQTVFNDSEKIFKALCSGASGYILKNDPPNKYLDAITEVYQGGASMNVSVAKKALAFFSQANLQLFPANDPDAQLSNREKEILSLMTQGMDYKTIAEQSFISYDTVRTHVKHIYKKLHVNSRAEALQKAARMDAFAKPKSTS